MKNLIVILFICVTAGGYGQDIFRDHLYPAELVMKHRSEIDLSEEQANKIKAIHNDQLPEFNNKKWDLDEEFAKLSSMIQSTSVDVSGSVTQLEKLLKLENSIKVMQMQTLLQIKKILTPEQQEILDSYKSAGDTGYNFITSVNEDPRVVVRVSGYAEKTNAPLYIIKGNPDREVSEIPKSISPDKIESIEVLKGESAISKYGEKGKNGVIIITLKE